ncbi:unnamed protein product [Trichobilharzia szidati]|nr:unnamed protein product [Trichobilharzia szidati]
MDTFNENIKVISDLVKKYKNDSSLYSHSASQLNEILKSDYISIEGTLAHLRMVVSSLEAKLDNLLFVNDELKRECEKLSKDIKLRAEQRKADIVKREAALREHNSRIKFAKGKLSIYEKFVKAKFINNENSLTAFIFNPDRVVQINLPITLLENKTSISDDLCQPVDEGNLPNGGATNFKLTDDVIAEMNKLWQQMEVSEKWKSFIMPIAESTTSESSNDITVHDRKILSARENLEK